MKKLVSIVALFGFLLVLTQCSSRPIDKVIADLELCDSKEEVKTLFDKYQKEFTTTNDKFEKEIDEEFLLEFRKKLTSLKLSNAEIAECQKWLPVSTSLNLVIVPDLSRRIIDETNNPNQVANDIEILNYIWEVFGSYATSNIKPKHRLAIDVTDEGQASGQFRAVANELIFDLPVHKTKHLRKLWLDSVYKQYYSGGVKQLYDLAKEKPLGADYWRYFKYNLSKHILEPTLYDDYRNVLIVITDGYLEAENTTETGIWDYTGDFKKRQAVSEKIKRKKSVEEAIRGVIEIPSLDKKFPTLEVLILEINKRTKSNVHEKDPGTTYDYEILEFLWTDWFKKLEIKNANEKNFFIHRNNATKQTKDVIDRFLK
jgi:hypothetical protein